MKKPLIIIKKIFRAMINGLLKPLGVNLCRAKSYELLSRHIDSKYKELIKEMEECFRELVFSELPPHVSIELN